MICSVFKWVWKYPSVPEPGLFRQVCSLLQVLLAATVNLGPFSQGVAVDQNSFKRVKRIFFSFFFADVFKLALVWSFFFLGFKLHILDKESLCLSPGLPLWKAPVNLIMSRCCNICFWQNDFDVLIVIMSSFVLYHSIIVTPIYLS